LSRIFNEGFLHIVGRPNPNAAPPCFNPASSSPTEEAFICLRGSKSEQQPWEKEKNQRADARTIQAIFGRTVARVAIYRIHRLKANIWAFSFAYLVQ